MNDLQAPTAIEETLIAPVAAASEESEEVQSQGLRPGKRGIVEACLATALVTYSSVLGSGDPWASPEPSNSVALEAAQVPEAPEITLGEARRLALDFSRRIDEGYRRLAESDAARYMLLTECSMGDNIAAEHPDKEMVRICSIRCPHMNEITMEDTRDALLKMQYVIDVPEDVRVKAYEAVRRMIDIGAQGKVD